MEVAQLRRLHVVYFLSRNGTIEHPHLIRVHHHVRNGVRLRDIKRWLGELRGKDMPGSFCWSYKRKYKTGYVWQDLLDDDLITPISDNEYVLKGSEISHTQNDPSTLQEEDSKKKIEESQDQIHSITTTSSSSDQPSMFASTKSSYEIEEKSSTFNSSDSSTVTSDSIIRIEADKGTGSPSGINRPWSEPRSKSRVSKNSTSSGIFQSLITCGAVDTKDSVVVKLNKQSNRPLLSLCSGGDLGNVHCKRDPSWAPHGCNDRKSFDEVKDSVKSKSELIRASPCASFAPINMPNCPGCPEKHQVPVKGKPAASTRRSWVLDGLNK